MAHGEHSDLEVVPPSENIDHAKYAYHSPEPVPAPLHGEDTNKIPYQHAAHEQDRSRTICGLRKRTFWIALLAAVIIVAAAVGGGVGGALSSKSSSKDATPGPNPGAQSSGARNASSAPTPTTSQPSITTSTLVGPSSTILRDCPSSNYTVYSATFGDTVMQFRKVCGNSIANANGQDNVAGRPVASLNDCINICAEYNVDNRTAITAGTNRICNAVCWRNTFDQINDWPGGMCFAFTTENITVGGQTAWKLTSPAETRCDAAALMNQEY